MEESEVNLVQERRTARWVTSLKGKADNKVIPRS